MNKFSVKSYHKELKAFAESMNERELEAFKFGVYKLWEFSHNHSKEKYGMGKRMSDIRDIAIVVTSIEKGSK